jgi:hypothetical protein
LGTINLNTAQPDADDPEELELFTRVKDLILLHTFKQVVFIFIYKHAFNTYCASIRGE